MRKLNVMVLMGGSSSERSVSLASGQQVVTNLDQSRFNALPVIISKDGKNWNFFPKANFVKSFDIFSKNPERSIEISKSRNIELSRVPEEKIDIVFIAMHGPGGEDGKMQGLLDLLGLKYTGSGVIASAIGMDKLVFRKIMQNAKILIPKYVAIDKNYDLKLVQKVLGKPPYFVKPSDQGSSVGMGIVKKLNELKKLTKEAFKYSDTVLVDEYIKGGEFTCAVIGNKNPEALPVIEIIPKKSEFFDFASKYADGGAEEIVPAKISHSLAKKIQDLAIQVYTEIGCKGFARVDVIVKGSKIYVLEINTIPGLTSASLLPKAAKAAKISYPNLLEKIINFALE